MLEGISLSRLFYAVKKQMYIGKVKKEVYKIMSDDISCEEISYEYVNIHT